MSTQLPIMSFWVLGRTKTKYHGAYPSGFLERARLCEGSCRRLRFNRKEFARASFYGVEKKC